MLRAALSVAMNDLDAVRLLHALVRIPSPSGQEGRLARFLAGEMVHWGFEVELDSLGNLCGRIGSGTETLTLVSHLDTAGSPMPSALENGSLRGRGVLGGKGALATFVAAAARLAEQHAPVAIEVVGLVGGETLSASGAKGLKLRDHPLVLVVGHTSQTHNLLVGSRGLMRASLVLEGETARDPGVRGSLAARACALWNEIERDRDARAADFSAVDAPWVELDAIRTHELEGRLQVELALSVHLGRAQGQAEALALLQSFAGEARLHYELGYHAYLPEQQDELLLGSFASAVRARGAQPTTSQGRGVANMCILAERYPTQVLGFAPGDARKAGTAAEAVALDEYLGAIEILTQALPASWAGALHGVPPALPRRNDSAQTATLEPEAAIQPRRGRSLRGT